MSIFYLQEDYRKAAQKEIRELEIFLGQGKAEDQNRYREIVGRIWGLKKSIELLTDVTKNHGEIEDGTD